MQTIKVTKGQSLMDIAIQEYGDVSGVFDIVLLNGLKGITDNVYEGDELIIDQVPVSNLQKTTFMQAHKPIATIGQEDRATGIGFWGIGKDFEVWPEN